MKKEVFNQAFKFAIVGVINTLINLVVLYIFTEFLGIYYLVSAIFAFIVANINSFLLNKIWTFKENIKHKAASRYIKFVVVSVIALVVNLIFLYAAVEYFKLWYMFAQVLAVILNFLINFFGNKIWTFRE